MSETTIAKCGITFGILMLQTVISMFVFYNYGETLTIMFVFGCLVSDVVSILFLLEEK